MFASSCGPIIDQTREYLGTGRAMGLPGGNQSYPDVGFAMCLLQSYRDARSATCFPGSYHAVGRATCFPGSYHVARSATSFPGSYHVARSATCFPRSYHAAGCATGFPESNHDAIRKMGFPESYHDVIRKKGFPESYHDAIRKKGFPESYHDAIRKKGFPESYHDVIRKKGFPESYHDVIRKKGFPESYHDVIRKKGFPESCHDVIRKKGFPESYHDVIRKKGFPESCHDVIRKKGFPESYHEAGFTIVCEEGFADKDVYLIVREEGVKGVPRMVVPGEVERGGEMVVPGEVERGGEMVVLGEVEIGGEMVVLGEVEIGGEMVIPGEVERGGEMVVPGEVERGGEMVVPGEVERGGEMVVLGEVEIGGEMVVPGEVERGGEMVVLGEVEIGGEMVVPGEVERGGEMVVPGEVERGGEMVVLGEDKTEDAAALPIDAGRKQNIPITSRNAALKQDRPNREQETGLQFQLSDEILGKGMSSIVFKGCFNGAAAAIKQIPFNKHTNSKAIKRERDILCELENMRHVNIIGFKFCQIKAPYIYLVLELCDGTLVDYQKSENLYWRESVAPLEVNRCMAEGLRYLHENEIVHRDLKPSNVLFRLKDGKPVKICLSDFGMAKKTNEGVYSISGNSTGTHGFLAPEVCDIITECANKGKCDICSDIFCLGILVCYSCTGKHPFGHQFKSQWNIINDKHDLADLQRIDPAFGRLVECMLKHEPIERPTIEEVCQHPALWKDLNVMEFFTKLSDKLESDKNIWCMIQDPYLIPNGNWVQNLPTNLQTYLENWKLPRGKTPCYRGHEADVYYLLRAIRNTRNHFLTYPAAAQKELGPFPSGHLSVWKACCPELLLHSWNCLPGLRMAWSCETNEIVDI